MRNHTIFAFQKKFWKKISYVSCFKGGKIWNQNKLLAMTAGKNYTKVHV